MGVGLEIIYSIMIMFIRNATLACCLFSSLGAADWPHFLGPNLNNSVPDEKIVTSFSEGRPRLVWETDVNPGYGGAAIVGDEVFNLDRVNQEFDVITCRELETGKVKWTWKHDVPGRISHPGSRGVPTVTSDAVYATSGFGHVYCIDRATHKPRWIIDTCKRFEATPPRFGYAIHPVIKGNLCFIAPTSEKIGLAALDIKTGKTVWTSESIGSSHSSPQLLKILGKDVLVMVGDFNREKLVLLGVDPGSGKTIFNYVEDFGTGIFNAIPNVFMLGKDTAVFTAGYGKGSRLLKFTGTEEAMTITKTAQLPFGDKFHIPLMIEGKLYMTADRGGRRRGSRQPSNTGQSPASGMVCFAPDGVVHWSTGKELYLNGGAILNIGGMIVSQDGDTGELRLIKPGDKYQELAKGKVFSKKTGEQLWAPMAFSNGKLVMRSQNQLICVDLAPVK